MNVTLYILHLLHTPLLIYLSIYVCAHVRVWEMQYIKSAIFLHDFCFLSQSRLLGEVISCTIPSEIVVFKKKKITDGLAYPKACLPF